MGIIKNLENTRYKNLRFRGDRFNQGSSNQPYVVEDINDPSREVGRTGGPDFIIRGGTLVPKRVANDVSRLTKMFFDLKSPNGPLFTAKQQLLSLSGTNFKAGFGKLDTTNSINISGFLKGGVYNPLSTIAQTVVNPLGIHIPKQGLLPPIIGPDKYEDFIVDGDNKKSRLVNLKNGTLSSNDSFLYKYLGGPKSIAGVGKTGIKRDEYTDLPNQKKDGVFEFKYGYDYDQLNKLANNKRGKGEGDTSILDFRQGEGQSNILTLDYTTKNFENRVKLGNPGQKNKGKDYQIGLGTALDKINAMPIYQSQWQNGKGNDFVKFRIGVIDNKEPNKKTFIHFRAILDDLSDSYSAEWTGEKLMGRGEDFYTYKGFTRTVNLAWTVAAQSKQELIPMYQKLNYLASSLTPDYTDVGYMAGNLVSLTLGGWFYEQPGIITGMTLSVPQESPWEIAIPSKENTAGGDGQPSDKDVKELPHIIKVTGVQFIPIHKFSPRLQQNKYEGDDGNISAYGKQRYIALSTGEFDKKTGKGGNNNYGEISGAPVNEANNYIPLGSRKNTTVGSSLTSKGVIKSDVSITAPSDIPNPSRPKKKKYKALPPLVGEATIDSNVFDQSTLEDQGWRMNQDDLSGDFN